MRKPTQCGSFLPGFFRESAGPRRVRAQPPWRALRRRRRTGAPPPPAPTSVALVSTGGSAPCSASSSAVRALISFAIATAAIVEPGATGVATPSTGTSASPTGVQRSMHEIGVVEQARARRVLRLAGHRLRDRGDRDDGKPTLARAPGHLDRHGRPAAGAEDEHRVGRAELEVGQDPLRETLHALDEHRLALAVRAHDLRVERHRELDDRVEARDTSRSAGTAPRPGCASGPCRTRGRARRAPIASRAEPARLGERVGLRLLDAAEQLSRGCEEPARRAHRAGVESARTCLDIQTSAEPTGRLGDRQARRTDRESQGRDARHRPDRPLLHADAARQARPRPRRPRLLALRGAGAGRSRATTTCRGRRRRSRRRSRDPETDTVVVGLPNHLHEEAIALAADARQGGALHEAAGAERARRRSGSSTPSSAPASSPATWRTSPTRRRR